MQKNSTVALISANKLLLLKRGPTAPWMPEKYCLPGGGVEDNESLIDAAVRELREETNIVLHSNELTPLEVKYHSGYSKTIFVCNQDGLYEVNLNWEHSSYVWASYQDCFKHELVPGLGTTIKTLCHWGFLM